MVGHRISFSDNLQKLKFRGHFSGPCALPSSIVSQTIQQRKTLSSLLNFYFEKVSAYPRKNSLSVRHFVLNYFIKIWITSSSNFSRGVSLRAEVSISSSYLYSKYCHVMRVFWSLYSCHYCSNVQQKSSQLTTNRTLATSSRPVF